jgi:Uma2 family endonuclease
MTEADYLALPEVKPYLEFVDGVVLQKAMPNSDHGEIVAELTAAFVAYRRAQGGSVGPERRVRLRTGRYRLPDTAYWAAGRAHGDDTLPTLAVEVKSPTDSWDDQRAKCRMFRESGVEVCWLIDPATRAVEVFEAALDAVPLPPGGALESAHLPGFSLPLPELFAVLDE